MSFTKQVFNLPTDSTGKCKISVFRPNDRQDSPVLIWSYGGSKNFSQHYPSYARFRNLLVKAGVTMVTYDYRGMCGDRDFYSTSLETRINDLIGVYRFIQLCYLDSGIILGGNSMGGYITIASLASLLSLKNAYGKELKPLAMILLAPAAYHWQAKYANFGPQFSEIIRKEWSWKNSDAFGLLYADASIPKMFICCRNDMVVLPEITDEYLQGNYSDKPKVAFLPGGHRVFAEESRVSTLANLIQTFLETRHLLTPRS